MPPKKITLKTSINSINAKAPPGKRKPLPKLKVILANPYKPENEKLSESDLAELKNLITTQIASSDMTIKVFLRTNNITLGFGSSLRAIKNKETACVLVSQSIKPKFIIDQIGYFTRQQNKTTLFYIVSDFESFTEEIFNIKSFVLTIPSNITGSLRSWISERKKEEPKEPLENKANVITQNLLPKRHIEAKPKLNSILLSKKSDGKRAYIPDTVIKQEKELPIVPTKQWTGDYISFSNETTDAMEVDEDELENEKHQLLGTLNKIIAKTKVVDSKPEKKTTHKKEPSDISTILKQQTPKHEEWEKVLEASSYINLQVHKVQPNPNRKQKKKRKNKKNISK